MTTGVTARAAARRARTADRAVKGATAANAWTKAAAPATVRDTESDARAVPEEHTVRGIGGIVRRSTGTTVPAAGLTVTGTAGSAVVTTVVVSVRTVIGIRLGGIVRRS
ncbi:hypothetical protein, partial [Planomonospora parontospora]|uniref:hypothetical protein n=1 Tax=Planomonospora parontospora TaxID=58119 RepID=UPI001E34D504